MSIDEKDIIYGIYRAANNNYKSAFRYLIGLFGVDILKKQIKMKDIHLGSGFKSLFFALLKDNKLSHQDFFDIIEENFNIDDAYKSIYSELISEYVSGSEEYKNFLEKLIQKYLFNIYKKIFERYETRRGREAYNLINSINGFITLYPDAKIHPDIVYNLLKYDLDLTSYLSQINDYDLENISYTLLLIIDFYFNLKQNIKERNELERKMNKFISYFNRIPNKEQHLNKICTRNKHFRRIFYKDFVDFFKSQTTIELDKLYDFELKEGSIWNFGYVFEEFSSILSENNLITLSKDCVNDKFVFKYINFNFSLYLIRENIVPKAFDHKYQRRLQKYIIYYFKYNFDNFFSIFCISKKFRSNLLTSFTDKSLYEYYNFFYYFIAHINLPLTNKSFNTTLKNYFFKDYAKMIYNAYNVVYSDPLKEKVLEPIIHMSSNPPYILDVEYLEPITEHNTYLYQILNICNVDFIRKYFNNNRVQQYLIYLINNQPSSKHFYINLIKKLKDKLNVFSYLEPILDSSPKEYVVAGHGRILKNSYFVVPDNVTIVFLTENTTMVWVYNYNRVSGLPFDTSNISTKKEMLELILDYGIGRIYPSGYLVPNTTIDFDFSWNNKYTPEYYSIFSGLIEDTDFDKKVTDVTKSGLELIPTLHKLDELNDISGCSVRFSKSKLNIDPITKENTLNGDKLLSDIITPKNITDYLKGKDPSTPVIFYILSCRSGELKTFESCYPSWKDTSKLIPTHLPLLRAPSTSIYTEIELYGIPHISNFKKLVTDNLSKIWNLEKKKKLEKLILSDHNTIHTTDYKTICYFYGIIKDEACKNYEKSFKTKYLKYRNKYLALKKKLNDKI